MENNLHIQQLVKRYSQLAELKNEIERAGKAIIDSYENGGKVLVCGNGGSASDSDHIVGELMKSFEVKRPVNQILKTNLIITS